LNGRALRALVICGPTASGKSSLAVAVARRLGGEIVNADSRQIYRGMEIGSGVPTAQERARIPHHLYAFVDPSERYSAARYVVEATKTLEAIGSRGNLPIVVGGTGFYIEALLGTMLLDRPPPDDELRERLRKEADIHPPEVLWEWLRVRAPAIASQTKPGDRYRIVRGLERALAERSEIEPLPARGTIDSEIVRLSISRPALSKRIERRVVEMFRSGIVDEAVAVRASAPRTPALSGLGYAEALALWDGLAGEDEAIKRTVARTVRYAKRQETWFRRMRKAVMVDAADQDVAIEAIATHSGR
jgi:tRNA dimethylallyltransferase